MSILDYIKSLFSNGKKTANIYTKMLKKPYGDKQPLEIGLYGGKTPIPNEDVGIEINKKQYIRTTDENGVAKLNINLPVGEYSAKVYWRGNADYNKTTAYVDVIITTDTYMDGIQLTKNEGDNTQYQCAVYRKDNNQRIKGNVTITINGTSYVRSADDDGLYKLNINLNKGTYDLTARYNGTTVFNPSYINNTITINEKPQPAPEPQKSRSEKILDYFEEKFGRCEYIDDALEKVQDNGYAFYFSDGYNMYETIDRMANYDGANCFDSAEVFYHLAKGMNKKYGRNYDVQYLDVWCPSSGYDHIRLRLNSGDGWFYRDPACVLNGGDITSNWCGTSNNILEVNPDWIYDGD